MQNSRMASLNGTSNTTSISLLHYMMITLDEMIDHSLDELENSENPIVQQMNRRVDEIQNVVKDSMQVPSLMEFMSMSVMLPLLGMGIFMFGGPPVLTGILAMAGPMYLLNFLQDNAVPMDNPRYLIDSNS